MNLALVRIIKKILSRAVSNLLAMAITEKFIFWLLDLIVEKTPNKVDDNLRTAFKGAYKNDMLMLQKGVQKLADMYDPRIKNDDPTEENRATDA
jgi:hypothetical protein